MSYNGEGVRALVCALDEMQNSNIMYADLKLARVLKCLAYYDEFRSVLSYCNRSFDYSAEKSRAISQSGEPAGVRLPKNPKTLVAFVANLLLEFDSGVDIIKFSSIYFPDISKQGSYKTFFERVVVPFKLAIVDFVVSGIEEEPPVVERAVEFAPNGLGQQTEYLIVNMFEAVRSANIDDETRSELLVMIEGLAAALDARDALMIKAVWFGLRDMLQSYRLCKKEIAETDEVLRLYLVTK